LEEQILTSAISIASTQTPQPSTWALEGWSLPAPFGNVHTHLAHAHDLPEPAKNMEKYGKIWKNMKTGAVFQKNKKATHGTTLRRNWTCCITFSFTASRKRSRWVSTWDDQSSSIISLCW
jgi:hypothetical protein